MNGAFFVVWFKSAIHIRTIPYHSHFIFVYCGCCRIIPDYYVAFLLTYCYDLLGDVMELDYINLGKRIAKRRKETNMKQNCLAEEIGISNNYLSSIERGREKPSLEILVKICNVLNVTPDYLLMGNMHSNNVPQNITDGLRLCSDEDIDLLATIMQYMVNRQNIKWNNDNFA